MRILLIGPNGRLGTAVREALSARHELVTASRSSGEVSVDIRDPRSIAAMYEQVGRVDAVACAAGGAPYKPLTELSYEDLRAGTADKLLGQVELVRQGIAHVADDGSFTVITGILARHPIRTGAVSSLANGALEAFVRAAAIELPGRQRINAVSPTVFTEALDVYGSYFPGFLPVPLRDVAATYVRSIEGAETGRVYELGD
jgi:NAD(P)-dependent dehydrogenase (short-subunit alcohol dehydrogenase family)